MPLRRKRLKQRKTHWKKFSIPQKEIKPNVIQTESGKKIQKQNVQDFWTWKRLERIVVIHKKEHYLSSNVVLIIICLSSELYISQKKPLIHKGS